MDDKVVMRLSDVAIVEGGSPLACRWALYVLGLEEFGSDRARHPWVQIIFPPLLTIVHRQVSGLGKPSQFTS